jgi:spermidine synthase
MSKNHRVSLQGISDKNFLLIACGTALISFGVLTFEVILTRIFSVMLSYHYVFAIISFALLGLGLGGLFLRRWQSWFPKLDFRGNASFFSLMIATSVIVIIKLPIYDKAAFVDLRLWIYIFLATMPFFFAGLTLAEIFRKYAQRSSVIYGFDLSGATLGALSAVALLNQFSAVNAALVVAAVSGLGALILGLSRGKMPTISYVSVAIVLAVIALAFSAKAVTEVPVAMDSSKDLYRWMKNPSNKLEIVETRWSSFGRTDLVQSKLTPEEKSVFVDGAAGSAMYNLEMITSDKKKKMHLVHHFGESFPFFFLTDHEKDSALIIGPGGGRDVVVALLGGVESITAVEVNPDIVQIVKDYEDFNGGIYTRIPNINVVVEEGRNYLRNSTEKFDLIMLALPITKSSRSLEGYSLTENYLFTVESFQDYLEHLTPEGRLVIVGHNDAEIYRLVVLALSAFETRGIKEADAMKHLYTLASMMMPTIVIKNQPFDRLEAKQRHELVHRMGYDQGNFFVPYIPQIKLRSLDQLGIDQELRMFDQILVDISEDKLKMEQLVSSSTMDIRPVTDDRPFFYKFETGLPKPFGLFSIFVIISLGAVLLPIMVKPGSTLSTNRLLRPFSKSPQLKTFLLIFFLLGVAFMNIEIAFLQKMNLYLGQPVLALTVLLFSILLGTGLGSFCSALFKKHLNRIIAFASLGVILLTILYTNYLSEIFAVNLDPKLTAMLFLLPLGFFLGFPFPLSIRLMKEYDLQDYIHWMWGVNGIASVVGSALTMIIGILIGFYTALYFGAVLYGIIALLIISLAYKSRRQIKETTMVYLEETA